MDTLRIAINAEFAPHSGLSGAHSVLIGLVHALGQLNDGSEEYRIICSSNNFDWLKPYLGANQTIVLHPHLRKEEPSALEPLKRALGPMRPTVRHLWRSVVRETPTRRAPPEIPVSDGYYENLGCELIHFAFQDYVRCNIPTVYNPHDLQHLHYPQFFTPEIYAWREKLYPLGCRSSHAVVVGSQWVKDDIINHYQLLPEKIQVIPWAPPSELYPPPTRESLSQVRKKYQLEIPFVFYPAATWEHKNHLRLLDALALLRERGTNVRLICTGDQFNNFSQRIENRIQELSFQRQVRFLGNVPADELRSIYRLAHFVILPSLFEGACSPMLESWQECVPFTCSNVTCLPELAGGAALLFDPLSVESIAMAIQRMLDEDELRASLVAKGKRRLEDFSWERTAKAYRVIYRRVSGRELSEEDYWLLSRK